jgi:2-polyprenyl-3-methyl-5-hydroxy-6-metoxy-1,4-benzoquinol methylase
VPAALAGLLPVGRNNERRIVMVEDAMTQGHGVYAMGRTEAERARLSQQDRVFAPHSENLFRQAGIREGMRVADIGCGVGDSTTLLARIVGPAGSVIGVDQDASSLEAAGRTVAEAGLSNVSFQQRTLPGIDLDAEVDALAGRLVLIHLDDPASILAELTRYVRPGGIVTFQDITISRARSVPEVPLMTRLIECCSAGMAQSGADPDFGDRLPAVFRRACRRRARIPGDRLVRPRHSARDVEAALGEQVTISESTVGHLPRQGTGEPYERSYVVLTVRDGLFLVAPITGRLPGRQGLSLN